MRMNEFKNKEWTHEITGIDGDAKLFGISIFECDWLYTGKRVPVTDPLYGQSYNFLTSALVFPSLAIHTRHNDLTAIIGGYLNITHQDS